MSNLTKTSVKSLLETDSVKEKLKEILGKNAATFATSIVQISQSNKMLAEAEPSSIVGAAMTAATLNLPLNNSLGFAWIIPFREKQKDGSYLTKAQFQIGYKGFVQLAMRTGQFNRINCSDIREGEIVSRDRLSGDIEFNWIDDNDERKNLKTIGYVAYFKLTNGYEATFFMTKEEMNSHAKKYSQSFKKGFGLWKDDFYSMAQKTVLKLLLSKKAPLSIEMQTAVKTDQASFNDVEDTEDVSYVDNTEELKEHDHEGERIRTLIENIENSEDVEFIRPHVTEAYLDLFKEKIKEVNKNEKDKPQPKKEAKK